MQPNLRFLLLLFFDFTLLDRSVVSAVSCPQRCTCTMTIMICTNPTFPITIPAQVIDNINIGGNIISIPTNAFKQPFGNVVRSLYIYPNKISNIASYAFNNLVLKDLWIYSTSIKHLEARAFANVISDSLSIYNSVLHTIPSFLFGGLTSVSLSIHNNEITTLETNAFKSAKVDTKVGLYNNKIDRILENAFSNDNLTVNIYMNNIKTFYVQDSVMPHLFYANHMMCICSLAWMWKEDSAFNKFLESNKCLKTSQYGNIFLKQVNQSLLCMNDNSSQTSEWETFTTNLNTEQFESSQPISKETPGTEDATRFATTKSSQPNSKETPGTEDTTRFATTKSSQPNSKDTPGTEDATRFATTKSSDPKSASLKPSVNLILIIIESVVVCLSMLF